jgi:hypothetical protein
MEVTSPRHPFYYASWSADAAFWGVETPKLSGLVPTGTVPILDLWSGSLWRMSRFSELKATGTGLARFSNSPITSHGARLRRRTAGT